jgi:hypothetical protein
MIVDMNVSAASKVVTMGYCPSASESQCGIQYRQY